MTADQPSAHAVPHPEIRQRADEILRYYRTIPDSDAIAGLCLRLASAEILDNRHSRMLAEVTADRERLRALVGDENQPGWDGCSRAEAIRQAEAKTDALLEWVEAHDARRDERDQALAEVERMRPIVLAAIAWREWIAGRLVDLMHAGPEETALIAAVDKLTEGSGR